MLQIASKSEGDLVWGASAIAAAINRTPRQAYYLLESGSLPGAKKLAGRWCFSPNAFRQALELAA